MPFSPPEESGQGGDMEQESDGTQSTKGGGGGSGDNPGQNLGALSAEERLRQERARRRRVGILTTVGERLLEQVREDMQKRRRFEDAVLQRERERAAEEDNRDQQEWVDFWARYQEAMAGPAASLAAAAAALERIATALEQLLPPLAVPAAANDRRPDGFPPRPPVASGADAPDAGNLQEEEEPPGGPRRRRARPRLRATSTSTWKGTWVGRARRRH
ncbi:uncharacterized protein LOC143819387 [Paroedura picta]|uniref:uncharacterized protein LOC143819387 n=1 Tax=Paroedura picta TaxID=143630 RepID=UPI004055F4A9